VAGSQVNLDDISAAPVFDHCDIEGGLAGFGIGGGGGEFDTLNYTHNIDLLPLFVSPSAGAGFAFNGQNACWQLQVESGCINAGDTTGIGGQVPAFDLAGNPRCNGMIDMGAYEFHQLPLYLSVCSDTITTGTTACFNALQTITTGGNGQPFLIQPGGATFLYAGNRISLLPGTVAEYGSYLLGRITPTGPWCQPAALPSSSGIASDADETGDSESLRKIGVAVFPNPTSGNLTIETPSAHSNMPIHIRCYNMNGTCILEAAFSGGISHEITLSGQRPGIYLVSVNCGTEHVMKKIIRRSE
jgi:hypothetical protein